MAKLERIRVDWMTYGKDHKLNYDLVRTPQYRLPNTYAHYKNGRGLAVLGVERKEADAYSRNAGHDKLIIACQVCQNDWLAWQIGVLPKVGVIGSGDDARAAVALPVQQHILRGYLGYASSELGARLMHTAGLEQDKDNQWAEEGPGGKMWGAKPVNEQKLLRDLGEQATGLIVISNAP
jgi:hypothetical protein